MSGDDLRASHAHRTPRALLFDLDGTLIATRRLYLECFADALEPVLGHRPTHEDMMACRPRAEWRFLLEQCGEAEHPGVMERFYRAYEHRHERDFEGVYAGIPATLARLRELGLPLAIVTGKSDRSWRITRRLVDLGVFATAVFDDDVPAPKPDPAGLHLALERLGCPPDAAAYVGDSTTDLEAARHAGVRPVAALWSKREGEREAFRALADRLGGVALTAPSDLLSLIRDPVRGSP